MRAFAVAVACALMCAIAACGTDEEAERERAEAEEQVAELSEEIEELRAKLNEGQDCEEQLEELNTTLTDLKSELTVGMSFSDYSRTVREASVAYGRIDVAELSDDCRTEVGIPLEDAFNRHIKAEDLWGDCIDDYTCDTDSIDPRLQRLWGQASDLMSDAKDGIGELINDVEERIDEAEQEIEEAESVLAKHSESE